MSKTDNPADTSTEAMRDSSGAIGAILVAQGRLSVADVDEILRFAVAHSLRFGDAALQMQLITQSDIDWAVAKQFNHPILSRSGEYGVADDVVAAYQPQSPALESLRALRSQLILRWFTAANRRTLTITSPERGEGRSWLAANLATMFAQLGERTLLIDADMRHPRQHEFFRIPNAVGLSALLTGRAGREIARRIHPHLRLFVLPAGTLPPNPQELLERQVFDVVLGHFAEQFSIVVIDTPSISESADAQIIASHAGAALMLARRNHTRHSRLTAAMESLRQTGVNIIGSVISDH